MDSMIKSTESTATPIPGSTALRSSTTSPSALSSTVTPHSLRKGLLCAWWTLTGNQDHRSGQDHRPQDRNPS
jgi:hypothetical protein